jgi:hypothetical protein
MTDHVSNGFLVSVCDANYVSEYYLKVEIVWFNRMYNIFSVMTNVLYCFTVNRHWSSLVVVKRHCASINFIVLLCITECQYTSLNVIGRH